MSNYSKTTDFAAKDSLPSGDSGKIIRGSEFETEFDAISTAIATKADAADPTFTGTVTIDGLTVNGNTTLGNAATDTVTVTADIASNLIPSADDTYNLGASGAEWNDLYVDGVAYIDTIDGAATSGDFTFTGASYNAVWDTSDNALEFADSAKATFGATGDLQIYHSGTHSFITDVGTGNLYLRGTNLLLTSAAGETYADFTADGAARLYYDGSAKLATTSTGVDVTGTVTADGLTVSASSNALITIADSTLPTIQKLDLQHNAGASSFISGNNGAYGTINLQAYNGTNTVNRLAIGSGGDISFYEDTGTTAKFFWDASTERLGIGTANPGATLDVDGFITIAPSSGDAQLTISNSATTGRSLIYFSDPDGTGARILYNHASNAMSFETNGTTERMRIDSSGNVGIGTTSPATKLEVANTSAGVDLALRSSTTGTASLYFGDSASIIQGRVAYNNSNNSLAFTTAASERMRIDSSGNVMVGKTVTSLGTAGVTMLNTGKSRFTVDGDTTVEVNRLTSDGTLVDFRKDGSTVGTIGSNTARFYIHNNYGAGSGFRFDNGSIQPSTSTGAGEDNTTDLGTSSARWKDLHLSGATYCPDYRSEGVLFLTYDADDSLQIRKDNGVEAARITSGGHLLVGKTAQDQTNNVGVELKDDGLVVATTSGSQALTLNRKASDGDIVQLRKDNTTIGSIGVNASNNLTIDSDSADHAGLEFGTHTIIPREAGTGSDGTIDLGIASRRFQNLYLSGGAYLGGTVAANKLDDYEEGTFTPVVEGATTAGSGTYTTQAGKYTKVGNLVFIQIYIDYNSHTGTGGLEITGLPFTPVTQAAVNFGAVSGLSKNANYALGGETVFNSAKIRIYQYDVSSTTATRTYLPMDAAAILNLTAVIRVD